MIRTLAIFICLAAAIGCEDQVPNHVSQLASINNTNDVLKQDRMLGMGVTEGSIGYEAAFTKARRAGVQFIELPQPWDEIEVKPGEFSSPFLKMANEVYPPVKTSLIVSINPIDTSSLRVPQRFKGVAFNDPRFIEAFNKFVDFVLDGLPDVNVLAVSIGNEVDGYLGQDQEKWEQYAEFFVAVRNHIKSRNKRLPIGVKITLNAVTKNNRAAVELINKEADSVMVTYYPLNEEFIVKPPTSIAPEIDELIKTAKGKPVYLLETGYPSGEGNRSSPERQSEFIDAMFDTWDKHAESMPLVNFVWLCDISAEEVDVMTKYYSVDIPAFASFVGSLGMLTNDGKEKPAFNRLKRHSASRGW